MFINRMHCLYYYTFFLLKIVNSMYITTLWPYMFSWNSIHPIQNRLLLHHTYRWISALQMQAGRLLESAEIDSSVGNWLQERDQLESLLFTIFQCQDSPDVQKKLTKLDRSFPHEKVSHILPQNHRLAEAFARDPSCWWGASAKMRELYDQVSRPQSWPTDQIAVSIPD